MAHLINLDDAAALAACAVTGFDAAAVAAGIKKNGAPDLEHTLNRLTMAGTPLRLISDDQLKLDLFFRMNQSFQAFFDASAAVATEFPALAPA